MTLPSVVIVSPAASGANNGNARTASRWMEMLATALVARVCNQWPDEQPDRGGWMLALHARRSAASIANWAQAHPGCGLVVVLTGTDLYDDTDGDPLVHRSLEAAQRLIVLQERGADALPPHLRGKARVVFQSTPLLPPVPKPRDALHAVMVGHLRAVKSPATLFAAANLLRKEEGISITHVGAADGEPALSMQARATAVACPWYTWLGGLPHDATRERIRQAHVLVHTSALEGGAHVVMEAVRAGTPVIASNVPGNVGMLGGDYAGYFPHGDAAALVALLRRCRAGLSQPDGGLLAVLGAQCAQRAPLFDPQHEQAALLRILNETEPAR